MTDQRRQDERLLAALRSLAQRDDPARRRDVWEDVVAQVPMSETEASFVASRPEPRGSNAFWFGTSMLGRAGLLEKSGNGLWTVTEAGRRVLEKHPDPTAFRKEASRAARENTKRLMVDRAARLSVAILPPDANAERIRQASLRFRERGLRQLSSVFAEHRSVWRADVTAELVRCFVDREAVDGASFLDKLQVQFADASDDARLLMAELVAWQLLPLQSPGERKKRERVQSLLNLMREPVLIPAEVDQAFTSWSFNPGQGMAHGIHNALSIVVRLVDQWVVLSEDERDELLDDPWAWRDFVASAPGTPFPTQRNELNYLVHPEAFGEVVSAVDRDRIRTVFRGEVVGDADSAEVDGDPDREFLEITLALQVKENGPAVYYREPLKSRWADLPSPPEEYGDDEVSLSEQSSDDAERARFGRVDGELAAALHMPEHWLQDTLNLIERRKQVILYGPPGTGKTFLAQALSKHVTDGTDGETTIVQFHPTYSYEDFFEGFRPVANDDSGTLAFSLRKGPLRRLADSAAANPEANYFLVIDEINRGNIAKVFGELYFLLEYRDSEISVLYSDEPFTLPSNIFVIGTMNTADRSIAMLDAAMRRRFAFIELHPERSPVRDVLAGWAANKSLQDDRAGLLTRLNAAIADHDAKVGPSFLMRDLDENGLADVWRYEILPLLAEYHYGDGVDLEARYGLAALRRQATPSVADGAEGADTAS
ncbi:AAA family ATPase [Curtobacterium albidum]|uniref:AAA family ATPase n=1 Tax=Curtobacterium citreum TaxID=2036 RepID=UPI0020275127|nr:AAA family ATPase [Curtobacterium albidum]MCL9665413.1 AAA family ATPase [Curtobacterium albidum]